MMTIAIFQINPDRDKNKAEYRGIYSLKNAIADLTSYDLVYAGTVDAVDLEDVYTIFNRDKRLGGNVNPMRSLSVSDIVLTSEGFYYCDNVGWVKLSVDDNFKTGIALE